MPPFTALLILFTFALLMGQVLNRFSMGKITGYLLAGFLLGSSPIGILQSFEEISIFAQLTAFLVILLFVSEICLPLSFLNFLKLEKIKLLNRASGASLLGLYVLACFCLILGLEYLGLSYMFALFVSALIINQLLCRAGGWADSQAQVKTVLELLLLPLCVSSMAIEFKLVAFNSIGLTMLLVISAVLSNFVFSRLQTRWEKRSGVLCHLFTSLNKNWLIILLIIIANCFETGAIDQVLFSQALLFVFFASLSVRWSSTYFGQIKQ